MTIRKRHYQFDPDWTIRPGVTLAETMHERGMLQRDLATVCGWQQSYVSDLITGRRAITARVALALEAATGVTAEMWMGLQTTFDLGLARGRQDVSDRWPQGGHHDRPKPTED